VCKDAAQNRIGIEGAKMGTAAKGGNLRLYPCSVVNNTVARLGIGSGVEKRRREERNEADSKLFAGI